jgi:hypothetical protein
MDIRTKSAISIEQLFSAGNPVQARSDYLATLEREEIIFGRDVTTGDPVLLFGRDTLIRDVCRGENALERATVIEMKLSDDLPRILRFIEMLKGRHDYRLDQQIVEERK